MRMFLAGLTGILALALFAVHADAQTGPRDDVAKADARDIYAHVIGFETSVEGLQTPQMAQYLADRFIAAGFAADDVHVIPQGQTAALVVRYHGDGSGGRAIAFIGHMDVVTAHRSDWERDPFTLIEENGYFFGRGTADNKGGVTALAATFIRLKQNGFTPSRDLILAFSGDEETEGASARDLVENHRDLFGDVEYALNCDAGGGALDETSGQATAYFLQTAEKSFASYTFTATNPGGHSSQPRTDNAIYDVMDALEAVRGYTFPVMWNDTTIASMLAVGGTRHDEIGAAMLRFANHPGDARAARVLGASPFTVGQIRTTCIPTLLQGGHADNALPQIAVATVNCRIFPGVSIEDVQAQLQRLAGDKVKVAPLLHYYSSDASPLRSDVLAATLRAVHAIHPDVPVTPSMSAGASDGVFYRNVGIPTYGVSEIFIKDSDDFSHGLNERVSVAAFYDGLVFWDEMIKAVAGG